MMSSKELNGFCPKCMMKHNFEEGEFRSCKCGYEFRQFECETCKKQNFFPANKFQNDQLYKCANESCKTYFTYSSCNVCTINRKLHFKQLKEIQEYILECQVCEDQQKFTLCPDCFKVGQISIKDLSIKDKIELYKAQQTCQCQKSYVNTSCPNCLSLLCFINEKPSEGLAVQCQVCSQTFGFIKGECCQRMMLIKNFQNKGEQAKCQDCQKSTYKLICIKCQKPHQLTEKQMISFQKGSPFTCKTNGCKTIMHLGIMQPPKKIQLNPINISNGSNYLMEFKESSQKLSLQQKQKTVQLEQPNIIELNQEELNIKPLVKEFKCLACNKQSKNAYPILVPCGHQDVCLNCVETMQDMEATRCPNCKQFFRSVFKDVTHRNFHQEILDFIEREKVLI